MKIGLIRVLVDDQEKKVKFYTEKLGFVLKADIPARDGRWLTVTAPEGIEGRGTAARADELCDSPRLSKGAA